jgi:hypothetical protein
MNLRSPAEIHGKRCDSLGASSDSLVENCYQMKPEAENDRRELVV